MKANRNLFLTARWERLILLTYAVPPEQLAPLLPRRLELDTLDGQAFLSLVAFDFRDTKVKGLRIPFHVNFPEINLRFYVRRGQERGVCFIRELVPRFCIALVARRLYNEPYRAIPMRSVTHREGGRIRVAHELELLGQTFKIQAEAEDQLWLPGPDSLEHFFKEHEIGYGHTRAGETLAYRVHHPAWQVYRNPTVQLDFDFGTVYGPEWAFLNHQAPFNTTLAQGSEIAVYRPD